MLQQAQAQAQAAHGSSSRACGPRPAAAGQARRGSSGRRVVQSIAATAAPELAPKAAAPKYQRPTPEGRYGQFGGKYVPETLIPALAELEEAYKQAIADPAFQVGAAAVQGAIGCRPATPLHATARTHAAARARPPPEAAARPAAAPLLLARDTSSSLPPPPLRALAAYALQAELDFALKEYVGRDTPLYYAERLSQYYKRCAQAAAAAGRWQAAAGRRWQAARCGAGACACNQRQQQKRRRQQLPTSRHRRRCCPRAAGAQA